MPSTEEQVKSIILKHKGSARTQQIARELKMSLDYIDLICRALERKGKVIFSDGFYSFTVPDKKSQIQNTCAESALLSVPKMTKEFLHVLEGAGYKTIESLADAPIARFTQETKLTLYEAAGLINQSRKVLNKIGE